MSSAYTCLKGAVDLHLHSGPSEKNRRVDFLEAARDADEVGMKAVVFKPLFFPTIDAAYLTQKIYPALKIFGGIILDRAVGGLEPAVVEWAIKCGAKVVWMPVFDAVQTRKQLARLPYYRGKVMDVEPVEVVDQRGCLLDKTLAVLDVLAEYKHVVLATGHLSPAEISVLIDAAQVRGIKNIVVTHPASPVIGATIEEQKEFVRQGAWLEHVIADCMPGPLINPQHPGRIAEAIKAVGAEHTVLATDLGNPYGPPPVEGLRIFITILSRLGINEKDIQKMIIDNPSQVLGLDC